MEKNLKKILPQSLDFTGFLESLYYFFEKMYLK